MINPKICPLCKKENACQVDISNNSCWCNNIKVPKELIELVPKEYEHKACICKACIISYNKNKELFLQDLKLR